jgi:hypothetical protein
MHRHSKIRWMPSTASMVTPTSMRFNLSSNLLRLAILIPLGTGFDRIPSSWGMIFFMGLSLLSIVRSSPGALQLSIVPTNLSWSTCGTVLTIAILVVGMYQLCKEFAQ